MSSFQIIVGSMLGGSEYVAEACEETLIALGHQVILHLQPKFEQINNKNQTWLICTSTHGAGDLPDNILPFVKDLKICTEDLSSIKFLTIGIGDTSYDTFCKAAVTIENILLSKGCNKLTSLKKIDMSENIDPEAIAKEWIIENKDHL